MSISDLHPWFVFTHIFGAFVFVAAHGVSIYTVIRLGEERDPSRISALLTTSGQSLGGFYIGLVLLLVGGVGAGISGGHFARLWIWIALALLIAVAVAMYVLATPYFKQLREAVGAPTGRTDPGTGVVSATPEEVDALVRRNPAVPLAAIGLIGFVIILWLMVFKPF
jgi:hypothetical protein